MTKKSTKKDSGLVVVQKGEDGSDPENFTVRDPQFVEDEKKK